ncbi:unnamed protein product [Mytilus edulis]|uniref:Delta-like protein n=1 Tax=Mytilus edulis TaxID=6550 RepID=A0A8S3RMY4_MYTED|nr:unnamed protein product [Mytilus edulis]
MRRVLFHNMSGCSKFTDCATNDMGFQYQDCNRICHNGGTYLSYCKCPKRWHGSCCDEDAHTCFSNPCLNGGTCIDGFGRYDCNCLQGWDGDNCELDVQPPIQSACPNDVVKRISSPTVVVNWTSPSFNDPMNTSLEITQNYPKNYWEFHWGDFQVQYVATKPKNGLRSECSFMVKIRPMSCNRISVGNHSAKVCTNWKTDYGQYCMMFCDKSFTIANENEYDQWYVCGASGKWIPSAKLPKCHRKYKRPVINKRLAK